MGAQRQAGYRAYSGQEACREDGISSGAGTLPGGFPGAGGLLRHRAIACMGLCCPAERQCGGRAFRILRARSVPGRWHLFRRWQTARRISGRRRTFPAQSHSLYGAVPPGGKAVQQTGFLYPGAGVYREDGISSGAGRLSGVLPGSGRIPRYMGNAAPKQIPPPHRSCHAAEVFSCTGTGRIRLRHRATWRRWGSRERRLPKPGRH